MALRSSGYTSSNHDSRCMTDLCHVAMTTVSLILWLGTFTPALCICPVQDNGKLEITSYSGQDSQNVSRSVAGEHTELRCCATGFDNIDWFKFEKQSGKWEKYPSFCSQCSDYLYLCKDDRNQSFVNKMSFLGFDDGPYKCEVSNDTTGETLEQEINLLLIDCSGVKKRPIPTYQSKDIYVKPGENITLNCQGNFGCPGNDSFKLQQTYWRRFMIHENSREQMPIPKEQKYETKNYESPDGVTVGTDLTIYNVNTEDYRQVFMCVLYTGDDSTSKNWTVKLLPNPSHTVDIIDPKKIIGCVIGAVISVGLVVVGVVCIRFWGPQFKYRIRRIVGGIKPNDKFRYDIAIIHGAESADPTRKFALEKFEPKLTAEGYRCFKLDDDIPGGDNGRLSGPIDGMNDSFLLCLIVTKSSWDDEQMAYFLSDAHHKRMKIVLVLLEDELTESPHPDKYEGMSVIKYPTERKNSTRLVNNFWCKVKLRLPSVNHTNSSSTDENLKSVQSEIPLAEAASVHQAGDRLISDSVFVD